MRGLCQAFAATAASLLCVSAVAETPEEDFWPAWSWPEDPDAAIETLDRRIGDWNRATGTAFWLSSTRGGYDAEAAAAGVEGIGRSLHASGLAAIGTPPPGVLTPVARRKLLMLQHRGGQPFGATPQSDSRLRAALADTSGAYGRARACIDAENCASLSEAAARMRDPQSEGERRAWWVASAAAVRDMGARHRNSTELLNRAAQVSGYSGITDWRRAHFEQADIVEEFDRLWSDVQPLYGLLACHVRDSLAVEFGVMTAAGNAIPEHWLGDLGTRHWGHLHDLVRADLPPIPDLTPQLKARYSDVTEMARAVERAYTEAGFPAFPESFWDRSRFVRPAAAMEVPCPRSGYNVDWYRDVRVSVCGAVDESTFRWLTQIFPFLYYDLAFARQDWVFRDPPHLAFHFGNAGAFALSLTPERLQRLQLIDEAPGEALTRSFLLRSALSVLPEIARAHSIDVWRAGLQNGTVPWDEANESWWRTRREIEGIAPPGPVREDGFDAGLHPYVMHEVDSRARFLGQILQFQWLAAGCRNAPHERPLHECSLFDHPQIGQRLWPALAIGASAPAPSVLNEWAGSERYSAAPLRTYFRPLEEWLASRYPRGKCLLPAG